MIEQLPSDTATAAPLPSDSGAAAPSRRAFIRTAALIGGGTATAFLLSACGGGESSGGAESSGSSDGGAAGEPITFPAAEVPVGGGVVIRESEVVVTQPTEGEFLAFSAVCTHQGCVLSDVQERGAHCGCHSSYFDISTGEPVAGPALAPLPSVPVALSGDTLTIG